MLKLNKRSQAVTLGTSLLLTGSAVQAAVLEEVTVTAQKREQNLQDVGISVTAFSSDQIKALGITNTVEIIDQVPGLQMQTFSPHLTIMNIRGVSQNNFTDNLEAPVAVYVDEMYMASMNGINAQLFDIDRVEVLRGPQGTLFGRNATGGVIHYLTNGADDEQLNGYLEASLGDYDRGALEFALGGAFADGIRARIAGRTDKMDGYMESEVYPEGNPSPPNGVDIGGLDGYSIRGELQFDLSASALLTVQYKTTEDDGVTTGAYSFLPYGDASQAYIPPEFQDFTRDVILEGGSPPDGLSLEEFTAAVFFCPSQLDCFAPVDEAGRTIFEGDHPEPFEHYSDYTGFMDRETDSYTAKLDWELNNGLQLVSITNYFKLDKFYTEDGDGIPVPIIEFTTAADLTQFSEELRLSGDTDRFHWVVGGYYLDVKTDADAVTRGPVSSVAVDLGFDPATLTNPAVAQDYELKSTNYSLFGQGEYDINDKWTLILGLRWSQDDKDMDFKTSFVAEEEDILVPDLFDLKAAAAAAGNDNNEVDYGDWAGRLQLDYWVNSAILAYGSYNRGIKGGNFAPSANVGLHNIRHDEEVLHAYEVGLKTDFSGGRVRLNGALFYYDYQGYQAFTFSDGTPSVANADAENMGAEIELFVSPNEHWDFILGAAFQDSEADGIETPQRQVTPVGFPVDWPIDFLNGNELPNTPKYSFNYLGRYNANALGGNISVQLDGAFYDDHYLEVSNGGGTLQKAYGSHNARASWWAMDEQLRVSAWVRNYTDQEYKSYALDLGILGATATYAPPRMYGVTVGYHFL